MLSWWARETLFTGTLPTVSTAAHQARDRPAVPNTTDAVQAPSDTPRGTPLVRYTASHPLMAAAAKPAFTVDVDQTTRVITITESGQLTGKSVIDMDAKLRAMPEYAAGFHVLVDATAITRMDATGDDIYQLATRAENDRNRFAIVVRDQFAVGLARMYEIACNWREERSASSPNDRPRSTGSPRKLPGAVYDVNCL